jgi:hypothetical protein
MAFDRFFVRLGRHLLASFGCRLRHCRLTDVCILSPPQTKINTFSDKDIEVFPKTSVSPTKTQGKKDCGFFG